MVKHRVELLDESTQPMHSASYPAGPKTRGFEKVEIEKMLSQNIIQAAQTGWVAPILFAPKKDRILHFCVDYRKLNAEQNETCIRYHVSMNESTLSVKLQSFSPWTQIGDNGK